MMSGEKIRGAFLELGGNHEVVDPRPESVQGSLAKPSSHLSASGYEIENDYTPTRSWWQRIKLWFTKSESTVTEDSGINPPALIDRSSKKIIRIDRALLRLIVKKCRRGFPQLAATMDSNEGFMIYRRFGFLQARILLNKQDELRALEADLDRMDNFDDPKALRSREMAEALGEKRAELLSRIEPMFKEYVELLIAAQTLTGFNKPSKRDFNSMKNYFDSIVPLVEKESFIYRKDDLVTLKLARGEAWLESVVGSIIPKLSPGFIRTFLSSKRLSEKADIEASGIILLNKHKSTRVVYFIRSLVITTTIITLLVVPIYPLWKLSRSVQSNQTIGIVIVVLIVFTFVFSIIMSLCTRAKRHEILAAAAGYCAVLVVFVGNVGSVGQPPGSPGGS